VSWADASVTVYRAYPGCWWVTVDGEMLGPFEDRNILRAVRIACTPTIDGCELGPTKLGLVDLAPRRALKRGAKWQQTREDELPPSVTSYDGDALVPVAGCCTVSEDMPKVTWGSLEGWQEHLDARPERAGHLAAAWNAHPKGSLLFTSEPSLEDGFVVTDLPRPE